MEYEIVSVRLPKKQVKEIEEIVSLELTDKSSVIRKSLEIGLKEYRIEIALKKLTRGEVSLWKAAEIAGVDYREMLRILKERGICFPVDVRDLQDEFSSS